MMESVIFKQKSSFSTKLMLAVLLLIVSILMTSSEVITFIVFLVLLAFLSIDYAYVFNKNGRHEIHIKFERFTVVKFKRNFIKPDYVSLFHQSFKDNGGFGFYPSIFGESKFKSYTIKLFNEEARETVFVSNKKEEVLELGTKLASLLDVELHNTLE